MPCARSCTATTAASPLACEGAQAHFSGLDIGRALEVALTNKAPILRFDSSL